MRPIRLTMTAFGPYKDVETIDFRLLEDRKLFVISGMTGAGKTTIFDAISYALYGGASGEDRADHRMLRSHFADEDVHTSVDFEFSVGHRSYRVFRQMGHRKGSNKSETGARIELYETTSGESVPCLDKFTVSEVNAKLEEIIGLTRDQFSQIVMLPQGEFRKLLTSDTENKEEILRRIFRTGWFQKLEDRFNEQSRQLKETHKEIAVKLEVYFRQADEVLPKRENSSLSRTFEQDVYNSAQVMEGLMEEQNWYAGQIESLEEKRRELVQTLEQLEQDHRIASEWNRLFSELDARKERLVELEQQQPQMDQQKQKLELAERAARIEPHEEYAVRAELEVKAKKSLLTGKQQEWTEATEKLVQAKQIFEKEEARAEERIGLEVEISRLRELQPTILRLDDLRQEVARLEQARKAEAARLQSLDVELHEIRQKRKTMTEQRQQLEAETGLLMEQERALDRLQGKVRLLQELVELDRQLQYGVQIEETLRKELQRVQQEHDRIEAAWIEGQASLLAAHLHDGEPCPVCGSVDHPSRATVSEHVPSRDDLMGYKEELRKAQQELHAASSQVAATRNGLDSKWDQVSEYEIVEGDFGEQLEQTVEQRDRLAMEVDQLREKAQQLEKLRKEQQELEQKEEQLAAKREPLVLSSQELAIQHSEKKVLLTNEINRIPEGLDTPDKLQERLNELEKQLQTLSEAWNAAQQQLHVADKRHVEIEAQLQGLKREVEEAEAKSSEARGRFAKALVQAGFADDQAYRKAKISEAERESLRDELEKYRQTLHTLKEHIAELEQKLEGREIVELEPLEQSILTTRQGLELLATAKQEATHYWQEARRLYEAIQQASGHVVKIEEKLEQVLDLYDVIRGINPLRMSFERYMLIDYLEQILQASNVRLQHLSNGQYYFVRSERLEARGRQSGLGLDVYDAYTGQNRDVKTLSGGEKFNASLALALGMTDVIQSHQGGVSIEMMFIDEGFGSLDEESLHKAIATLVDLQQAGRMIGVISHVTELKEAFPAVLEVIKTKEGYSRTVMTVK